MYSKNMNTQELKLADNYLGLLEFLPMSVQRNIIERFFEKHNKELKENLNLDRGEESPEELRKIASAQKHLTNNEFLGLWKDREEMADSTQWVKQVREQFWQK